MIIYNTKEDECPVNEVLGLLKDGECYVYGTINKWDGPHELYVSKKQNLLEAIDYAQAGGDDYDVDLNEGKLVVHSYHHDGVNEFTIGLLSKKGIDKLDKKDRVLSKEIKPYHTIKTRVLNF